MISDNILNHLVNQADKIANLASNYKLNEISLLQPQHDDERSKLYFVISRHDKWILFDETAQFKRSLYDLLEVDLHSDDVNVDVREAFTEEHFTDRYGSSLTIFSSNGAVLPVENSESSNENKKKSKNVYENNESKTEENQALSGLAEMTTPNGRVSRKGLINFINQDLGFTDYIPPAVLGSEEDGNLSQASRSMLKHVTEAVEQERSPKKAKLLSSSDAAFGSFINQPLSGALFARSEREIGGVMPMNMLSPELQQLADTVIKEIKANPGYADAMLAVITEGLTDKDLMHGQEIRRMDQVAAN